MHTVSYSKKVLWLIAIVFIVKCCLSFVVHLGNDEAYYFTYALQPDWNHFDHPPLVGIFIKIFTGNLAVVNDLTMRLAAYVAAAGSTWLMYKTGCLLKNERTGWIAAVLYNTSIYANIIAGFFILPDSPQMFFWIAAVYVSLKIILNKNPSKTNAYLLWFGTLAGIAAMCKIHGVFLWFGFGMYALLYDRKYFSNIFLYLSILLFAVIVSPIFFWNVHNNFIAWKFQSERVEIHHAVVDIASSGVTLIGEIFYANAVNILIYILALIQIKKANFQSGVLHLLNWFAFPIIFFTTAVSLFRTTLPHWSGPGFAALIIISAYVVEHLFSVNKMKLQTALKASVAFICATVLGCAWLINFYPGTMGSAVPPRFGDGDFTLDMYGWNDLKNEFATVRKTDIDAGLMNEKTPLVIDKWFPACHYLLYVTYPLNMPIIGVGDILDIHKFAWLNSMEGSVEVGENAYFIASSEYFSDPQTQYKNDFKKIILIKTIPQYRSGKLARYWYIYRMIYATHPLQTRL